MAEEFGEVVGSDGLSEWCTRKVIWVVVMMFMMMTMTMMHICTKRR